jgi:hypothetical protein
MTKRTGGDIMWTVIAGEASLVKITTLVIIVVES